MGRRIVVRECHTDPEREAAMRLESRRFAEMGFVDVGAEYAKYLDLSTFVVAVDEGGACLGMVRMVGGSEALLPPFLAPEVALDERRHRWEALAREGKLEEFATVATEPEYATSWLMLRMARHALQSSEARGVTHWGLIREPPKAQQLERIFHVPVERVGPDQHYMGETVITAPFVIELARKRVWDPILHAWLEGGHPAADDQRSTAA